jgi:DNA-binding response OmpR family regulator
MALILLVEDDRNITAALTRALSDAGHVVRPVGQAGEALKILTEERPDLVILDLGLPDIDGLEVGRHIRARMPTAHLIALTGFGDERMRARVRDAGFADHLLKPVELDALRRALAKVDAAKQ